jgi:hypothetical protein
METEIADVQASAPVPQYGKDIDFDLQTGMVAYGADGEKIGRVTEVEGFGSTQVVRASPEGIDESVTQAHSGTGYFKVNRQEVLGSGATDLCVPFRGIQDVTAGHGVTLNGTIISETAPNGHPAVPGIAEATDLLRSGWRRWLPGKR